MGELPNSHLIARQLARLPRYLYAAPRIPIVGRAEPTGRFDPTRVPASPRAGQHVDVAPCGRNGRGRGGRPIPAQQYRHDAASRRTGLGHRHASGRNRRRGPGNGRLRRVLPEWQATPIPVYALPRRACYQQTRSASSSSCVNAWPQKILCSKHNGSATAFATKLATAYATACPQLAKADVRALTRGSGRPRNNNWRAGDLWKDHGRDAVLYLGFLFACGLSACSPDRNPDIVTEYARLSDVTMIPLSEQVTFQRSIAETALFGSGRPTIVFPLPPRGDVSGAFETIGAGRRRARSRMRSRFSSLPRRCGW